jgi:hypothetical protein
MHHAGDAAGNSPAGLVDSVHSSMRRLTLRLPPRLHQTRVALLVSLVFTARNPKDHLEEGQSSDSPVLAATEMLFLLQHCWHQHRER